MPSSTSNGAAVAPGSPPSSTNGSPSSMPSSKSYSQLLRELDLANQARLMRDNDNGLQLTLASDRLQRQQTLQLRAAQMAKALQELQPAGAPAGDAVTLPEPEMGDINVSSPKTENHYHPQPAAPPAAPGMSALQKAALAAALASGLAGAGAAGYGLASKAAPAGPSAPASNITRGIGSTIDLVNPKAKNPQP